VPLGRLQTLKFTQSINQSNKQSVIQASVCIALVQFDVSFRQFALGISREDSYFFTVQREEPLCHTRGR
jgi:hypothetical protein